MKATGVANIHRIALGQGQTKEPEFMRELFTALHLYFMSPILTLLWVVIIVYFVMSWLFVGGIIDGRNPTARNIWSMLQNIVEPLARPIRRFVPNMGGFDLSLFIVILAIPFVRDFAIPSLIRLIPF